MKAITASQPGGPEVLEVTDRPQPQPGPGEVLIEVAAAGVNRPDIMQRSGALPAPPGVTDILGLEVSGTVLAVGEGVQSPAVGETVMALLNGGGYAECALASADLCLPVPEGLSPTEAAVLPEGLFTLWHNLFERGRLAPGETVLIHGGSSGIGTLGIQLALATGVQVITTAGGPEKCARLEAMGARAIDYRTGPHAEAVLDLTQGEGVNVVLDIVGGAALAQNLDCLAPEGRHVSLSFMAGPQAQVDLSKVMRKGLWLTSSTLRPKPAHEKARLARAVRQHLLPLLGPGKVAPLLSRSFPLTQAAEAHRFLESGQNFGKIALQIAPTE
ncbi:NAD(P)H-quinone oxidoreductase [Vannielia litorea]|uniref:NAD(P)H-quinone oxidoreductase n=1 Tax=Vannielia litorea TaxID=1217970 RepID=UPI001C9736D6|nr:NAD(P)H-quinone oxidoreductase [Vannielia litorea]MBY6048557.1 NAD(P)H-quinone oxidoreductase [Vannielia litorea]MBY6075971.1 NAD(P)H-quinone oxidoreductase [Vannielia litorea]